MQIGGLGRTDLRPEYDIALASVAQQPAILFKQFKGPLDRRATNREPIGNCRDRQTRSWWQGSALDIVGQPIADDIAIRFVDRYGRPAALQILPIVQAVTTKCNAGRGPCQETLTRIIE